MEPTGSIETLLDEALDTIGGASFSGPQDLQRLVVLAGEVRSALAVELSHMTRTRHLETIAAAALAAAPAAPAAPAPPAPRRRPGRMRRFVLRPVAALAAAALIGGPAAAAFASDTLPGDALYGTKLAVEKVRLLVETDPAGDVDLHLAFAERRVAELSRLLAEGASGQQIAAVMSNLRSHQSAADRGAGALRARGRSSASLDAHVESVLRKHVEVLTGLADKAGCDESDPTSGDSQCTGLLNALDNSQKVLEKQQEGPPGLENKPESPPGRGSGNEAPNPNKPSPAPAASPSRGPKGGVPPGVGQP